MWTTQRRPAMTKQWTIIAAVAFTYSLVAGAFVSPARQKTIFGSFVQPIFVHGKYASPMAVVSTPVQDTTDLDEGETIEIIGSIAFLLPSENADTIQTRFGRKSPVECPSLLEAASHLANKSNWFSNGRIETMIVNVPKNPKEVEDMIVYLSDVEALIAFGLISDSDLDFCAKVFEARRQRDSSLKARQCQFALECEKILPSTVGPFDQKSPSLQSKLLPWTRGATGLRLHDQMLGLFNRWTSDDFTVALMLFFNQFSGSEIDWVKHSIDATWEKGPIRNAREFYAMVTKCGDCITKCLADEKCNECLTALNAVDTRDQVLSYRTIVSYESELLRDFSLCILQKNNIFGCDATIPTIPKVNPISKWRGNPLTSEAARSILVAHLDDEAAPEGGLKLDASWKVAAGANVAYDQFPSQNQLFYESVSGKDMWYDPIFRVETIDGRNVWCKRHYKVRDGQIPGTFRFSVLDNGITSNEFWTIAGVADDLSWIVFHYAGAAGAVGQRYIGSLLCTPDGSLPPVEVESEIWKVLRDAGIQPWELYIVNNDPNTAGAKDAGPPPLNYFLDGVRAAKTKWRAEKGS